MGRRREVQGCVLESELKCGKDLLASSFLSSLLFKTWPIHSAHCVTRIWDCSSFPHSFGNLKSASNTSCVFFEAYEVQLLDNATNQDLIKCLVDRLDSKKWLKMLITSQNSGRWIIEDPAVMYVGECFAYVLLPLSFNWNYSRGVGTFQSSGSRQEECSKRQSGRWRVSLLA